MNALLARTASSTREVCKLHQSTQTVDEKGVVVSKRNSIEPVHQALRSHTVETPPQYSAPRGGVSFERRHKQHVENPRTLSSPSLLEDRDSSSDELAATQHTKMQTGKNNNHSNTFNNYTFL